MPLLSSPYKDILLTKPVKEHYDGVSAPYVLRPCRKRFAISTLLTADTDETKCIGTYALACSLAQESRLTLHWLVIAWGAISAAGDLLSFTLLESGAIAPS